MKYFLLTALLFSSITPIHASCDIRFGQSVGVKVIEFVSGHVTLSKMPLKEASLANLKEETFSLQEMGLCEEKIERKKCLLKFEKKDAAPLISFYRDQQKWLSWNLNGKKSAQQFVKILQHAGFCV
jgi:hypothetical protein